MDKKFAFELIMFFIICACFITWSSIKGPKRNTFYKVVAYGYTTLVWSCIIALIVLTVVY